MKSTATERIGEMSGGAGLRVLVVHNRYRSALPSGENNVVDREIAMLRDAGVRVSTWIRDSDDIGMMGPIDRAELPLRPIWSVRDSRAIAAIIDRDRPQIMHLHNPYPLISPAVIRTAKRKGIKVVQTVHNYRHSCLNGLHLRDGKTCTLCVGRRVSWPGVRYGCYRDSAAQSAVLATAEALHHPTWNQVDLFFALSQFMADHLVAGGISREKVVVKPNFVDDPGPPTPPGEGFLFAGRLEEPKGVLLLLEAWERSGLDGILPLVIAGDGPLRSEVERRARVLASVDVTGPLDRNQIAERFRACAAVVVPSLWFEGLPGVVLEAFAHGRPVLATDVGALPEVVGSTRGRTVPVDVDALATALGQMYRKPPRPGAAREEFERTYERSGVCRAALKHYDSLATSGSESTNFLDQARAADAGPRSILLVGPDGSGKSAIAEAIERRLALAGVPVRRAHVRPGIIGATRASGPVTDPHAQEARNLPASAARTIAVFVDSLLGWVGPWRAASRQGVLLIERGWHDQAVDPLRYRSHHGVSRLVELLGRALPRAGVAVLLGGDPVELVARKGEIGIEETARQLDAWRSRLPRIGRETVEVDTTSSSVEESVDEILNTAFGAPALFRVPLTAPRLKLCASLGPAGRIAAQVYRPLRPRAQMAVSVGLKLRSRWWRAPRSAARAASAACAVAEDDPSGLAAMHSSTEGRWIVAGADSNDLLFVAKVGQLDDPLLRNEISMLRRATTKGVAAPVIRSARETDQHLVLVFEPLRQTCDQPLTSHEIVQLCRELHRADMHHGDLAPWNVVRTPAGTVMIDWEHATLGARPVADLAHYLCQEGALLGEHTPEQVATMLLNADLEGLANGASERALQLSDTVRSLRRSDHPAVSRFRAEVMACLA